MSVGGAIAVSSPLRVAVEVHAMCVAFPFLDLVFLTLALEF